MPCFSFSCIPFIALYSYLDYFHSLMKNNVLKNNFNFVLVRCCFFLIKRCLALYRLTILGLSPILEDLEVAVSSQPWH